ncbi:MAG: TolC family protein [Bacteroidota bacterium]
MRYLKYSIGFVLALWSGIVQAQEILSLEQALRLGLENNYQVKIARNNETIARNNNNLGNAGFLPRVTNNNNISYTSNNTKLQFFSGDSQEGQGAGNTSIRAGLALTWTAFDGFRMFATRDRLAVEETRSQAATQSEMHDLVTQIQSAYYGLVRLKQQIGIIEQSIQLNTAIKNLAEAKLQIGTGTSLDVLQTSNSLNADSSNLLSVQDQLLQAKIGLNRLMGRDANIEYQVPIDIPQILLPSQTELTNLALTQNHLLKLLNFDEQIALLQIKEARSALYPTVDINAGYNYAFSRAEVGFVLSNRAFGPTVGLSVNYDLFPGRNIKKDIENAELFKQNIQLNKTSLEEDIRNQLAILYQEYTALGNLLALERKNLNTAQTNTELAEELYRSGRATSFEVREAILAETLVLDRLSDVEFRQKLAEIQLKSLAGIPLFAL